MAEASDSKGIGSLFYDYVTGGGFPGAVDIRYSAFREQPTPLVSELYGEGPTFIEQLQNKYGYDTKSTYDARPEGRQDLPTIDELIDARAHLLGGSFLAVDGYYPKAIKSGLELKEYVDRVRHGASSGDVAMDTRNNELGLRLFEEASMFGDVNKAQLNRMAEQQIFSQLDRIMGRKPEERKKVSPKDGPDVYFPRTEEGKINNKWWKNLGIAEKIGLDKIIRRDPRYKDY